MRLLQILKATDYLASRCRRPAGRGVLLANILNVERIRLYVQFVSP